MRRSRALLVAAALTAGCRLFQPGLPATYDGGVVWVYDAPGPEARAGEPDARPEPDAAAPDEPGLPGPPEQVGCADGTREGFASLDDWMNIAGCAGAWS